MANGWLASLEKVINIGAELVKAGLEAELQARRGAQPVHAAQGHQPAQDAATAAFQRDQALVSGWYDQLEGTQRAQALAQHLATLPPQGRQEWLAHLRQMHANVAQNIEAHQARANQAWGGSFEDRMAYGMAQLRTGQSDPAHQRRSAELQDVLGYIEQLFHASEQGIQPPPVVSKAAAVKAAIIEMSKTGTYPGGPAQMHQDVIALVQSGEGDEVMSMLNDMGFHDGGRQTLNFSDHYRPGTELYKLRWPVAFPLPVPFDELDRPTQFSVLFTEWTRREAEACQVRNQGDNNSAQFIFEECLARAHQMEVPELIARSHEGLASVAQRLNERTAERQHLKLAVAAREFARASQ
jgi:hypothetical protein